MSSASLNEKKSSYKTVHSLHIDSSSSIASAPTSAVASRFKIQSAKKMKEQHRTKERNNNLLSKSFNRHVQASNNELSTSDVNDNDAYKYRLRNAKNSSNNKQYSVTDSQTTDMVELSDSTLDQLQQNLSKVSKIR